MTNRQAQCKRVFVAIKISASLAEQITEWEKKLRNLPVRWLAEKNMHVTLIPPWYELDVDKVKGALNQVGARISTFSLEFHRVSYGPNPRAPRLKIGRAHV